MTTPDLTTSTPLAESRSKRCMIGGAITPVDRVEKYVNSNNFLSTIIHVYTTVDKNFSLGLKVRVLEGVVISQ